jgi:hypothetical protein
MNSKFKIGEIVVCINAKRRWYRLGGLQLNEMYTVTGFNPYDGGLILKEVKSPRSAYHAFASNRFRKVDYTYSEKLQFELQSQQEPILQVNKELKQE